MTACPLALELDHVRKSYGAVAAVEAVSLCLRCGGWLALTGPSGSGKSTLVNLLGCLDQPTSGRICVLGQDLAVLTRGQRARFRAEKIGFVFQHFHLVPYLTALENVMLAQQFHSVADATEACAALDGVGLADRVHHLPAQLSGGERQRVCIARALINDPGLVLADEPTGNLDAASAATVMELLAAAHRAGRTIVMVTHDPAMASRATQRLHLAHGRIVSSEGLDPAGVPPRFRHDFSHRPRRVRHRIMPVTYLL